MFRNANAAVKWAARIKATLIIDGSSIYHMAGPRISTYNELLMGLSPQEAHTQSGMIIRMIRELRDPACAQYLLARNNLADEIDDVMQRVFARMLYSGGIHNRDVRKVVLKYMGAPVNKREIRESLHCDRNKVNDFIDKVYAIMDSIHNQALDDLDVAMMQAGLIERREVVNA